MINIKTLALGAALATGLAFAMPAVTSQAMPVGPVKIQAAQDSNIIQTNHRKRKWRESRRWRGDGGWRERRRWRHNRRFARYCDPWDGCYRRRHARFYRSYDEPYYGYGGYPYGGYYGPGFYGPGIGLQFRIN